MKRWPLNFRFERKTEMKNKTIIWAVAALVTAVAVGAQDYSVALEQGTAGFRLQGQQLTWQIAVEDGASEVRVGGVDLEATFFEDGHSAGTISWVGPTLDGASLSLDGVVRGTLVRTGAGTGGGGGGGGGNDPPPGDTSPCAAEAGCVLGDRFEIQLQATGPDGPLSVTAVELTDETVYFWFRDENNVEVFAKVPSGTCGVNGRFWFFAGGATDVDVEITLRDTRTGDVQQYSSTGRFTAINDTAAFDTCDA